MFVFLVMYPSVEFHNVVYSRRLLENKQLSRMCVGQVLLNTYVTNSTNKKFSLYATILKEEKI